MNSRPSPTRTDVHTGRAVLALALAVAVLTGGLVTPAIQTAHALPGECQPKIVGWTPAKHYSYFDEKGNDHLVEYGSKPIFQEGSTCDVIIAPERTPGDGSGSADTPPIPPSPPGPALPAPPMSVPAGAGPKCVAGANNDPIPGSPTDTQTGTGGFVVENVEAGLRSGDLKLESTAASRVISMDVNLGEPTSGRPGSNPFEGYSPEDAAQAMYWEGANNPIVTDTGVVIKTALELVKLGFKAAQKDGVAREAFLHGMKFANAETRSTVVLNLSKLAEVQGQLWASQYGKHMPEELKWILEGILELVELAASMPGPVLGAPAPDAAPLYAAASLASDGSSTAGGASASACGQVASASVAKAASLTGGSNWVTITLTGTANGTLIDRLKALDEPLLTCPPVSIDTVAAQPNIVNITKDCVGTVTGVRLLTKSEIHALPGAARRALVEPTLDSLPSDVEAMGLVDAFADADSISWAAEGAVGFSGDSLNGDLSYKAPREAAGLSDALVAVATDTDGVEHPFLVKVAVKAPPTCRADGSIYGLDPFGNHGVMQGGRLMLTRGQPFVIDPKMLCGTDFRDTYRVDLGGTVAGTTRTVDADGSLAYTWTDPNTLGDVGTLTLQAWDETTGAPTDPISLPVFVRDLAPVCGDVHVDYHRAALKGAPLTIDLACAMPSGLSFATPIAPQLAAGDGTSYPAPGGTFHVAGAKVTFTPKPTAAGEVVSEGATVWSSARGGAALPRQSAPFRIAVNVLG